MTTDKTPLRNNATSKGARAGGGETITLGIQLAVMWVLLIGGGAWLDRRRGEGLGFTFLGFFLSLAFMVYELWKITRTPSGSPSASRAAREVSNLDPPP